MLYLYTNNSDGTINFHCQSNFPETLLNFAAAHNLHDYYLTGTEPVEAQGKYWLDADNVEYIKAHELDLKALEDAKKQEEADKAKPTLAEQFTELQEQFNLMSEALDCLIMDSDTEVEDSISDSGTTAN